MKVIFKQSGGLLGKTKQAEIDLEEAVLDELLEKAANDMGDKKDAIYYHIGKSDNELTCIDISKIPNNYNTELLQWVKELKPIKAIRKKKSSK